MTPESRSTGRSARLRRSFGSVRPGLFSGGEAGGAGGPSFQCPSFLCGQPTPDHSSWPLSIAHFRRGSTTTAPAERSLRGGDGGRAGRLRPPLRPRLPRGGHGRETTAAARRRGALNDDLAVLIGRVGDKLLSLIHI